MASKTRYNYIEYAYDWRNCEIYGLCPNGFDWQFVKNGTTYTVYAPVEAGCPNCYICVAFVWCIMGDEAIIIDAYQVEGRLCGFYEESKTKQREFDLRLNEIFFLMKQNSILPNNERFLLPKGISDTIRIREYVQKIENLKSIYEKIPVYILDERKELKEFDNNKIYDEIKENGNNQDSNYKLISINPIPFSDFVFVNINANLNSEFRLNIYNMLNKKVFGTILKKKDKKIRVDLSDLPTGVYIFAISDVKGNIFTKKIIKSN